MLLGACADNLLFCVSMQSAGAATPVDIYSWGWVGWSTASIKRTPQPSSFLLHHGIKQLACSERKLLLLSESGRVYTCSYGAISADGEVNVSTRLQFLLQHG